MKKILGFICLLVFATLLTACGGDSNDSAIVGTWASPASEVIGFDISLTFNANGRGSENWDDEAWAFEWETSDDSLMITFEDDDNDVREMTFEVDGDSLNITGGTLAGEWIRD